jgi:hypothetical protein
MVFLLFPQPVSRIQKLELKENTVTAMNLIKPQRNKETIARAGDLRKILKLQVWSSVVINSLKFEGAGVRQREAWYRTGSSLMVSLQKPTTPYNGKNKYGIRFTSVPFSLTSVFKPKTTNNFILTFNHRCDGRVNFSM